MALTITIEGKGVIANCDAETNDTGGTGTGDWSEQGGGTMSLTNDVYLYGNSSIAGKYASKSGFQQFDLGSGNELDFDTGGTEEGQFIYMWINLSTFGVLETLANKGLAIRISSSSPGTSNYKDYTIAGSDGSNGWTGGWKLFVIDPTKTASATNGTCDIGAIRTLGVWIDTASSVRAESLFIDQIAVGKGLRVTGTSTVGWQDVMEYCTDYANRAWGMVQERDGIYFAYGKFWIGDSTQAANTSFADSGRIIQWADSEYYVSSAWAVSVPSTFSGVVVEDAASYTTTFDDGVIVGTDNGRAGTTFLGSSLTETSFDLYGGSNTGSLTRLYGTGLYDLDGGITWGNDANHLFYGGVVSRCGQFDPVGAVKIRNCTFSSTTEPPDTGKHDSALLWNSNMDISNCGFIANTDVTEDPHAIEFTAAGTYNFTDMLFSGNDYDIENSSTGLVTINATDSDPSTYENTGTGTTAIVTSVDLTMTVKDQSGTEVVGAYAYIDEDNDTPFIMNTTTNASGIATVSYGGGAVTDTTWRIRKYGYKPYYAVVDIGSSNISLPVTLITDPQQT